MRRAFSSLVLVVACGSSSTDPPQSEPDAGSLDGALSSDAGPSPFDASFGDASGDAALDPCGQLIDFESIPGGMPSDGLALDLQFKATYGVSFSLEAGPAAPLLAKVGAPTTAFQNDEPGVGDTPKPGQKSGSYFLTDDGVVGDPPAPLVIRYEQAVAGAYGEILDIDGSEQWTVEARDVGDAVLASVVLTAGETATGDAVSTPFSFQRAAADIRSLRIRYTGAIAAVGLAFDNFSPACSTPRVK